MPSPWLVSRAPSTPSAPCMPRKPFSVREHLAVRNSGIHGKGVFARKRIPSGVRLLEYTGERVPTEEGYARYPYYDDVPYHTFLFTVDDDTVIDAAVGGGIAKWINHSCDPNCESVVEDGRIFIESIRPIKPGEELAYDYKLITEGRYTPEVKRRYPCECGAPNCRGTMLGKKR